MTKHHEQYRTLNRVRHGKTEREHVSGVWRNRFANRAKRRAWQQDERFPTAFNFPSESCNGKRNRYRVTGKNGNSVLVKRGVEVL